MVARLLDLSPKFYENPFLFAKCLYLFKSFRIDSISSINHLVWYNLDIQTVFLLFFTCLDNYVAIRGDINLCMLELHFFSYRL